MHEQTMDIAQLETFLAIARLGSVSKAATHLHRSQPAISRRLGLLEAEIGVPLFERIRTRMQLTDAGRALRPHAEAALAAAAGGLAAVGAQLGRGAGSVSLGIVGTLVDRHLAGLLARFREAGEPDRLQLTTASSEAVSELVRDGVVATGVRYFLDRSPDVVCTQIGWERMVVVSAPRRGRTRGAPRSGQAPAAAEARWVGFTKARAMRDEFGRLLAARLTQAGAADQNVMVVDSLSAQKRLIEAGFGLGFLPYSSVTRELDEGTLALVDMPRVATKIAVALVHRRTGYLSPAAEELMALLRTEWSRRPAAD
jgi:DNA-binding transcriptional LysR family regulator